MPVLDRQVVERAAPGAGDANVGRVAVVLAGFFLENPAQQSEIAVESGRGARCLRIASTCDGPSCRFSALRAMSMTTGGIISCWTYSSKNDAWLITGAGAAIAACSRSSCSSSCVTWNGYPFPCTGVVSTDFLASVVVMCNPPLSCWTRSRRRPACGADRHEIATAGVDSCGCVPVRA